MMPASSRYAVKKTLMDDEAFESGFELRFSGLASDDAAADEREARELLEFAEKYVNDEEVDDAWTYAKQALELLRKGEAKNPPGTIDALRIMIQVHRLKDDPKSAERMASDELVEFRYLEDKQGQAAMLMSLCEINTDRRGSKKREEALVQGTEARQIFRETGDVKGEADTLLALVSVLSKQNKAKETMMAANDALKMFRQLKDRKGEAKALHALAIAHSMSGRIEDVLFNRRKAKQIFNELGLKRLEAAELHSIAQWNLMKGSVKDSVTDAEEALAIFREVGQARGEAAALAMFVRANCADNEVDKAISIAEEGLEKFQQSGDKRGEAAALDLLADAYLQKGEAPRAMETIEMALTIAKDIEDKQWEANMLHTVAQIHMSEKNYDKALKSVKEAMAGFQECGDTRGEAVSAVHTLVYAHMGKGQFEEALKAASDGREILAQRGDKVGEAIAIMVMGCVYQTVGMYDDAFQHVKKSRDVFKREREWKLQVKALKTLANMFIENDNPQEAAKLAHEALTICQKEKDRQQEVVMAIYAAQTHVAVLAQESAKEGGINQRQYLVEWEKALAAANQAKKQAQKLGDTGTLANALYEVGEVYMVNHRFDDALNASSEAVDLFREVENKTGEGATLILMSNIYMHTGKLEEALGAATMGLALAQETNDEEGEKMANSIIEKVQGGPRLVQAAMTLPTRVSEAEDAGDAGGAASSVAAPAAPAGLDPQVVRDAVNNVVGNLVGDGVAPDVPFMDAGVDSLLSIQLRQEINKMFTGLGLPSTITFDYPNAKTMSDHIIEKSKQVGYSLPA
eukprot:gnl/TRDRNA2_/TRDRNA2_186294_c0_seq1.p1 gnl/TRDRNA2_/TRDRNA2_186294_c0~~gnl/TRDRNA2_/TRDRNA2_186294_c0_seq1.p1  ORF type:complete len:802 (-),score=253.78 gnl/TRDRNA2_/TRDRNA2_186294_c0_seq1:129-2534(-)